MKIPVDKIIPNYPEVYNLSNAGYNRALADLRTRCEIRDDWFERSRRRAEAKILGES